MLVTMSDLDHRHRFEQRHRLRQMTLAAFAALALAILAIVIASASVTSAARADDAKSAITLSDSDRADIDRVSTYLSGLANMQGNFLQVGPDGSLAEGRFYLRRPGRLRFEYSPPEKILVVADGTWVAVKDGYSATQRYPLGATPLGILLEDHVNLGTEVRILGVERQPGSLRVKLADKSGNAPGDITLVFDEPSLQLRQWVVTDAQGLQTTVALRSIQNGIRADNGLFVIKAEQRPMMKETR
ncbi:MAG: outer membrane lipoprotein carrier protein LolA [Pseudomonadota bacterium]